MRFYCTTDDYWVRQVGYRRAVYVWSEDSFVSPIPEYHRRRGGYYFVRRITDEDAVSYGFHESFYEHKPWMCFTLSKKEVPF